MSDFVSPVTSALASLVATLPDVTTVYAMPPDGPPDDHSVVLEFRQFKVVEDTNARLKLELYYAARYMLRRGRLQDTLTVAYGYLAPMLQLFASWENQTLGGLAMSVSPMSGAVAQMAEAGTPYVAAIVLVRVVLEFPIPL